MPLYRGHNRRAFALGVATLLMAAHAASAHETHSVKQYRLTLGWGDEPAYSGYKNSVDVDLADETGAPITDLGGGSLAVEVSFGDERLTVPLLPYGPHPGRFRASLVPTRPGTYAFHVTGLVKGQAIDVRSTCSEATFHCVTDAAELQFPVKDPSAGQLGESVARALPRAERAADDALIARRLAMAALGLAAAALAIGVGLGARKGKQGA
jgi:hypothetical protein